SRPDVVQLVAVVRALLASNQEDDIRDLLVDLPGYLHENIEAADRLQAARHVSNHAGAWSNPPAAELERPRKIAPAEHAAIHSIMDHAELVLQLGRSGSELIVGRRVARIDRMEVQVRQRMKRGVVQPRRLRRGKLRSHRQLLRPKGRRQQLEIANKGAG